MALVDAQLSWLANIGASYFATGKRPARLGNEHPTVTPYQPVRAMDKTMIIAVGNERLWAKFCKILGAEEMLTDPRFATNAARNEHRSELIAVIEGILRTRPAAAWVEELVAAGVPAGPINFPDETLTDEHVIARRMIVELEHPLIGIVKSIAVIDEEARRPVMSQFVDQDHHSDQDQVPPEVLKQCHKNRYAWSAVSLACFLLPAATLRYSACAASATTR